MKWAGRQANAALHRIVQTRLCFDPRTQNYYERLIKEGRTQRENRRAQRKGGPVQLLEQTRRPSAGSRCGRYRLRGVRNGTADARLGVHTVCVSRGCLGACS
ncbi:hypothetical protein Scel_10060 [Streptomyces cellostaticus]|nr:hypothetical protein Scel_10060 [Streptomyces cellostaticus]